MNSATNGLKRHPLSALFSRLDLAGEDLAALVEDIKDQGLLSPITTHEGMVLDGWNRYTACGLAGVEPVLLPLHPGADPWEFVKGSNMLRRHMSPAERVAVMLLKMQMGVPNGTPGEVIKIDHQERPKSDTQSVREIAKDLEVSFGTAQKGAQIAKANDPALIDALADKKVSLDRAAELAKMPEEERHAAMEAPKPATKAKPADVEALEARVKELEAEREDLRDRLQEMASEMQALQEEVEAARRALDAEDLLEQFKKEVVRAQAMSQTTQSRNNGLMNENRDLMGRLKSALRKIERLEKAVAGVAA